MIISSVSMFPLKKSLSPTHNKYINPYLYIMRILYGYLNQLSHVTVDFQTQALFGFLKT